MKIENKSRHAAIRSQQRGIPQLIIDWLITYGAVATDGRGASTHYFDHHARCRLSQDVGVRVAAAMRGLPDRQREAIVLCHYQELSNIEAAGLMGVSVDALESLLARGRRALRGALSDMAGD